MNYAYYGLPSNYLETYRANIEKVTKDDVVRVAKKYVHADDLSILVVGKAADFDKPLDTLGKVTNAGHHDPEEAGDELIRAAWREARSRRGRRG